MNLFTQKYKLNDEYKILELFRQVFNKDMKLKYWRWRYNRSNKKYITLMFDNEILVGHYAIFPLEILYNGNIINTGFSMTTMTSSEYKNLGIFKSLAKQVYLDSYNELKIIWGFPNDNSLHGFVKYLEWNNLFDINMLMIDIESDLKNRNNNIYHINQFTNNYDELFLSTYNKYKFIVKRDKEYLNWRFVKNTTNKYYILEYKENNILKGYCVYKIYVDKNVRYGDIVDFLAINKCVFKELIDEALFSIKQHDCKHANIWATNFEYKTILYNLGFYDSELITHFGMRINGEMKISNDIGTYYLTMSDSDVF